MFLKQTSVSFIRDLGTWFFSPVHKDMTTTIDDGRFG